MKQSLLQKLSRLNVVIVSHIFATGPALDLEEYLKDKVHSLFFIGHPFSFREDVRSFYRSYSKRKFLKEYYAPSLKLPDVFMYLKDAFLTIWWVMRYTRKIDLYVGSDNFVAFLGLFLKKLGKVQDVVLYTIDYMPVRFENRILNSLYHFFDKACLKNCKIIWNVSPVMADAREKQTGMKREECVPQIVVPLGMWYERIPKLPFNKKKRYQLVFMGHLIEKQGLDVVIRGTPLVLRKIPKAHFLIVGGGSYEGHLKNLVKRLKLDEHITFTGYIDNHKDVERLLAESMLAVAMYKPDTESFTQWADPGKLKNYAAAGLPIILTSIPPVAKEIEERGCGIIVDYNEDDFARAATRLLNDRKLLDKYSRNATLWAKQFDWNKVFAKTLKLSL